MALNWNYRPSTVRNETNGNQCAQYSIYTWTNLHITSNASTTLTGIHLELWQKLDTQTNAKQPNERNKNRNNCANRKLKSSLEYMHNISATQLQIVFRIWTGIGVSTVNPTNCERRLLAMTWKLPSYFILKALTRAHSHTHTLLAMRPFTSAYVNELNVCIIVNSIGNFLRPFDESISHFVCYFWISFSFSKHISNFRFRSTFVAETSVFSDMVFVFALLAVRMNKSHDFLQLVTWVGNTIVYKMWLVRLLKCNFHFLSSLFFFSIFLFVF